MKGGTKPFSCDLILFTLGSQYDKLDRLMNSLDEYYEALPPDDGETIRVGLAVATIWPGDNLWYRGVVKAQRNDEWEVHFVDYGDTLVMKEASIRPLERRFCFLPAQAIRAKLAGQILQ